MTDKMIDWLTKRGAEEAANIQSKNISSFKAMFTTKQEFDANQEAAQRSLGKMEMIDEILKYYVNELNIVNTGINND